MTQAIFALTRLDAAHGVFTPVSTAFVSQVSNTLSNFGTDADGFDSILSNALLSIDADQAAVSALPGLAADAEFVAGAFASIYHTPLGVDLAAFQATGDTLAGLTDAATTPPGSNTTPVPVPPVPVPPITVGGGGVPAGHPPILVPAPGDLGDPGLNLPDIGAGNCFTNNDPNCDLEQPNTLI